MHTVPTPCLYTQHLLFGKQPPTVTSLYFFIRKWQWGRKYSRNLEHYHYYAKKKKKMLLTVFPSVTWCALRWKPYDSCDSWLPEITWDERGRKTQKLYLYLLLNFSEIPSFNSLQRLINRWGNDRLLRLTVRYCYTLNFWMFYAKYPCGKKIP